MCLIKNGEEKSLEMELAHIYLCLAFLCFAWRGGGLALALREGPPPLRHMRGAGMCHRLPGLMLRERGGGARRLPQFKSLGRLEPSLSHFLLLSFFLGFFFF